jgi:hypothetical protein
MVPSASTRALAMAVPFSSSFLSQAQQQQQQQPQQQLPVFHAYQQQQPHLVALHDAGTAAVREKYMSFNRKHHQWSLNATKQIQFGVEYLRYHSSSILNPLTISRPLTIGLHSTPLGPDPHHSRTESDGQFGASNEHHTFHRTVDDEARLSHAQQLQLAADRARMRGQLRYSTAQGVT